MKKLLLGLLLVPALALSNYALNVTLKHEDQENTAQYVIAADSGIIYQINNDHKIYLYVDEVKDSGLTVHMMVSKLASVKNENGVVEEKEINAGETKVETEFGKECTLACPVEGINASATLTITETDAPATATPDDADEATRSEDTKEEEDATQEEAKQEEEVKEETPAQKDSSEEVSSEENPDEAQAIN